MTSKRPRIQLVDLALILYGKKNNKPLKVSKTITKNNKKTTRNNIKQNNKSIKELEKLNDEPSSLFSYDAALNGTATSFFNKGTIVLTRGRGDIGSIFSKNVIDISDGFEINFNFQVIGEADGFAFVIQNSGSNALGGGGGLLGYTGIRNGSLAIEFDNYVNPPYNDPSYDHVSIQVPDSSNRLSSDHIYSIGQFKTSYRNQNQNHCRILYDSRNSLISVYVTLNPDLKRENPLIEKIENVALPNQLPKSAYLGFTGSCGWCSQETILYDCTIQKLNKQK